MAIGLRLVNSQWVVGSGQIVPGRETALPFPPTILILEAKLLVI
jgi:hypothetical protein